MPEILLPIGSKSWDRVISALGDPFTLRVSAYPDDSFNADPVELQPLRVPEPSTVLLLIAPLALFGARRLVRREAANDSVALAA